MATPLVVKIQSLAPHPNATKLKICQVFDGTNTVQVVCGAANARAEMVSILAPVGTTTPTGRSISASSLRGIDSHGMLCSPQDLGVLEEKGLVDLPQSTPLGLKWHEVERHLLSSTPWYRYQLVESFIEKENGDIFIHRPQYHPGPAPQGRLLSQTYFSENSYLYRHY